MQFAKISTLFTHIETNSFSLQGVSLFYIEDIELHILLVIPLYLSI